MTARHGTNRCYIEGCRRPECLRAHVALHERWRIRADENGGSTLTPAWRARRRIEALMAIGYGVQQIADEVGCTPSWLWSIRGGRYASIRLDTMTKIDAAYRRLEHTPGPSNRMRSWAKNRSWPPPAAWEDIDNPRENAAKAIRKEHP